MSGGRTSDARLSAVWPLVCFAALGNFWGAFAALVPAIKAQVGATDGEFGIALLFAGVGAIPMMLLTGRIWRRAGWWLLPAAGLLFALTILAPIFASTPLLLAVALLLAGAGSGALDVSMNAAISDVEADRGQRLMFGAHALFSLGVLVSAVATGFARELGAQPAHVLGSVSLVTALVALGTVQSSRNAARVPAAVAVASGSHRAVSSVALLAALCATAFLVEDAVQNWSALHIERGLGASPALGGAAPGIFAAAMFVGRSLGQRLGARFSERALLSGGALGAAIGAGVLAFAPSVGVALAALALAGAGISMVAPALFARAGRLTDPAGRGAAIARVTALGYSGFIVGPGLVGVLAQLTDLRTAIASLSLLALGVAIGGAYIMRGDDRAGTFGEGEELLTTARG